MRPWEATSFNPELKVRIQSELFDGRSWKQKEPHDGTHHAALKMASISYTRPSVASVGSSIADVIANPLSAW